MKFLRLVSVLCATLFSNLGADLTLEEEIGQLLIPYIDGQAVDEATSEFLRSHRPGGIIYYNWSNTLSSPEQVKALSQGLQKQASELGLPPLFIAADQEGGVVARLRHGFTEFPGNAALGRTDSEELAFTSAREMGIEMMAVGVNFTFSPVVDVNSNPNNPVIGIRSYGNDPKLVARFGSAASEGFSEAGVISCLKHFPGHGDTDIDSHYSLPILHKSRKELEAVELVPFRKILNRSPAIMTAHIRVPKLDSNNCATLSKLILTDLLRNELGYQGLIVSDSLTMGAVIEDCGDIGEAGVRAFEAGNDLLIIGGGLLNKAHEPIHESEIDLIREALLQAVKEGRITRQRLKESVDRILSTKRKFQIGKKAVMAGAVAKEERQRAEECAFKIAERAVRVEKRTYSPELWDQRVAIVAPRLLAEQIETSELSRVGRSSDTFFFEGMNPTEKEVRILKNKLNKSSARQSEVGRIDTIIFLSYNAWRFPGQEALLSDLSKKYPLMLVAVRDARDAELELSAETVVTTVSPTAPALRVIVDRLTSAAVEQELSYSDKEAIGMQIWSNECNQKVEQLVYWKDGEQWPSVGIGHFIWPPESYQGTFRNGRFHLVLGFLKERGVVLPEWLDDARYSPWNSAEEFHARKSSAQIKELRALMVDTVPLQAEYMVDRFWSAVPRLLRGAATEERHQVVRQIRRLLSEPGGLFALVDYLNFKHEGTAPHEEYDGVRWGLKQVLLGMGESDRALEEMILSAKRCLKKRVAVSPKERNEERWIPGWFARLDRYRTT